MTNPQTDATNARRIARRARRRTAKPTGTGSQIISTLERVWKRVQQFGRTYAEVEIPDVIIITGSGQESRGIRLAHVAFETWDERQREGRSHELFVSGETLGRGAESALTSVLHEATHIVARLKGVQDTSRDGRYHNQQFVETARTFALDYQHEKKNDLIGFSAVTLTDLGRAWWADELAQLEAEIRASIPTVELVPVTPGDPTDDRVKIAKPAPAAPTRRRNTYRCECRTVAMFPDEFEAGPVACGVCFHVFTGA